MLEQLDRMQNLWPVLQSGFPCLMENFDSASGGVIGLRMNVTMEEADQRRSDGPEQRVVQLYDALRSPLYRYLINIGVSPQDVEEIVQEVFLRLYRHMRGGGNEENIRSWVYQVANFWLTELVKSKCGIRHGLLSNEPKP